MKQVVRNSNHSLSVVKNNILLCILQAEGYELVLNSCCVIAVVTFMH